MSETDRSDTKYGNRLADHDWSEPDPATEAVERTEVKRHQIDVVYVTDPGETGGYGREKYTVHLNYDDELGNPHVSHVVEHRWKGNYWRDTTDWDFGDIPEPVRQQVAAVLPVDRPTDLDTDIRVIDEGGESRFKKYHKPALEAHAGGEDMWAESYLKEASKKLDGAAESLSDGDAVASVEDMVGEIQGLVREIRTADTEADSE